MYLCLCMYLCSMIFALVRRNCNNCNILHAYRQLVSGFSIEVVFKIKVGFTLEI